MNRLTLHPSEVTAVDQDESVIAMRRVMHQSGVRDRYRDQIENYDRFLRLVAGKDPDGSDEPRFDDSPCFSGKWLSVKERAGWYEDEEPDESWDDTSHESSSGGRSQHRTSFRRRPRNEGLSKRRRRADIYDVDEGYHTDPDCVEDEDDEDEGQGAEVVVYSPKRRRDSSHARSKASSRRGTFGSGRSAKSYAPPASRFTRPPASSGKRKRPQAAQTSRRRRPGFHSRYEEDDEDEDDDDEEEDDEDVDEWDVAVPRSRRLTSSNPIGSSTSRSIIKRPRPEYRIAESSPRSRSRSQPPTSRSASPKTPARISLHWDYDAEAEEDEEEDESHVPSFRPQTSGRRDRRRLLQEEAYHSDEDDYDWDEIIRKPARSGSRQSTFARPSKRLQSSGRSRRPRNGSQSSFASRW